MEGTPNQPGVRKKLDHFLVYQLTPDPAPVQATVWLQGQFDTDPVRTDIVGPVRIANPAYKLHDNEEHPIRNHDHHFTWYRVTREPEPERIVRVRNQFGKERLTVGQPLFLMVPAQKEGHEEPKRLRHFLCYKVSGEYLDKQVRVSDQFLKDGKDVEVGEARLLAVPVAKSHTKDGELKLPRPKARHLVMYDIGRNVCDKTVWVRDQFLEEPKTVTAIHALLLGAPSRKKLLEG